MPPTPPNPIPPRFQKPTREDLVNRFCHHPPRGNQADRYERVRAAILVAAVSVVDLTPCTPEQTRALNALDEAMFLANAAIARGEMTDESPAGNTVAITPLSRVCITGKSSNFLGCSGRILIDLATPGFWWVGLDRTPTGAPLIAPPGQWAERDLTPLLETCAAPMSIDQWLDQCGAAMAATTPTSGGAAPRTGDPDFPGIGDHNYASAEAPAVAGVNAETVGGASAGDAAAIAGGTEDDDNIERLGKQLSAEKNAPPLDAIAPGCSPNTGPDGTVYHAPPADPAGEQGKTGFVDVPPPG